jgi:hypothetical protein
VKCAARFVDEPRFLRSSSRLSTSTLVPAYLAELMPGAPSSSSTEIPESSAIDGRPVKAAAARALMSAFSSKVSPSSTGSGPS